MKNNYLFLAINQALTFHSAGKFTFNKKWKHSERIATNYEFILGISGVLHLQVGDDFLEIKKDDFVVISPGTYYNGAQFEEGDLSFYWCHFESDEPASIEAHETISIKVEEMYQQSPFVVLPMLSDTLNISRLHISLNQLFNFCNQKNANQYHLNYLITSILFEISNSLLQSEFLAETSKSERTLSVIQQWIKAHCRDHISLEDIAVEFNYNKSYLSRIFSKQFNQTVTEYINTERLLKSKELLLSTSLNIEEISNLCGFKDKSYFYKLFKKTEQMTPSEFRNTYPITTGLTNE
ncbi:helix-turn-helix transcriptional regulator [Vagococcus sp. BWB3-3]|uniref:Helix-turn-helix transcriptional regulator n=1 Tax=Vagococcus allomyrinae TaxID=2794353 RepID=A0A940PGK6_9ENTE|nr:AraC family transcriptional regulator [Vagococcus allomyrinae]MBP1042503.1 helix-turn-helix transcriptional regulator [Vagococcus allomyrinae]